MLDVKFILLILSALCFFSRAFLIEGDTCHARCGSGHDSSRICQCNSACLRFNDCCSDYNTVCTGAVSTGNCSSLDIISAELWNNDVNRFHSNDFAVNYQTQVTDGTTTDQSSQKFFTHANDAKLSTGTYKLFIDLLNNYDPARGAMETVSAQETHEDDAFLDAILGTRVMGSLLKYLTCRGIVTNQSDLKSTLKKLWFEFYPRSGSSTVPDTCGFEHMMVGEYKDSNTVNGFHSWVSFYEKEKAGLVNYFGYVKKAEPNIVGAVFSWNNHVKTMGSFFIGVSPEFEIAIYSLCFLTSVDRECKITLNGFPVTIMTFSKEGHIATGYVSP